MEYVRGSDGGQYWGTALELSECHVVSWAGQSTAETRRQRISDVNSRAPAYRRVSLERRLIFSERCRLCRRCFGYARDAGHDTIVSCRFTRSRPKVCRAITHHLCPRRYPAIEGTLTRRIEKEVRVERAHGSMLESLCTECSCERSFARNARPMIIRRTGTVAVSIASLEIGLSHDAQPFPPREHAQMAEVGAVDSCATHSASLHAGVAEMLT